MLKTSRTTDSKTWPIEGGVGIGGDSRARRGRSGINDIEVGGGEVEDDEVEKKTQKSSKSKNLSRLDFFTPRARLAFTKLRQAFVKAPILYYFDLECHIRIETDASGYTIGGVLSQLTWDNLGRWHLMPFFSQKMIPPETRYEIHNGELLAIVKAFKTWRHYLERS